jgi:hypothetical protein
MVSFWQTAAAYLYSNHLTGFAFDLHHHPFLHIVLSKSCLSRVPNPTRVTTDP